MIAKLAQEEVIQKFKLIHGNLYDYSDIIYNGMHSYIDILCKSCNCKFTQKAYQHANGQGCKKCKYKQNASQRTLTTALFIKKAQSIHGADKFNYSLVNYIKNDIKIEIICNKCGKISKQRPHDHLNGSGCPYWICKAIDVKKEFIIKANIIHNYKYDYSFIKYINCRTNIEIICPEHGIFQQKPSNHLQGKGCKKCTNFISKLETKWLDLLKVSYRQWFIVIGKDKYCVDGFDPKTNTIYEFYGDYWHGNPKIFPATQINKQANMTCGELYQRTLNREYILKNAGYRIISIWENEWNNIAHNGEPK